MEDTKTFKVVILGEYKVGKTSLINKKLYNDIGSPVTTVAFNHKIITINVSNEEIKLDMFDTAGSEQFNAINSIITRNCHIFIFMYSCEPNNYNNGFDKVKQYYNMVKENSNIDLTFVVQNKIDNIKENDRDEAGKEGAEWCKLHSAHFHQISSLTGYGVDDLFNFMAQSANKLQELDKKLSDVDLTQQNNTKSGCQC